MDRRQFLAAAAAVTGIAAAPPPPAGIPKLKKAVKFGMIRIKGSNKDKLDLAKKVGFQGVEIDSPSKIDLDDLIKARDATGVVIHGTIDSVHWTDTLSHPDPAVRARGVKALETALNDAKKVGADTALLVPGVVKKEKYKVGDETREQDVTYEICWERSVAEVKKVLPLAEKLQVKIAIEVVWNNFLTKPEQLVEYVDTFKSPWVGAYFDASNMLKYGVSSADWIRKLGKRMLKMDFKGYSKAGKGSWVGIGEGDEDWPEVLKACGEVGYTTWATAEVSGGGEEVLADISARMDKILQLK